MKIIDKNISNLQESFWDKFSSYLDDLSEKDKIYIWLSWWSSLNSFYEKIAKDFHSISNNIREKICFLFLDERIVPLDNEDSNYYQVNKTFLEKLKKENLISEDQIIKIDYNSEDIAKDYSQKVWKIDIALFWAWPDAHIASLFPNHELLDSNKTSYLQINNSPKPPSKRITISPEMIKNIDFAFLFFIWESKKDAFDKFLDENLTYKDCPAKLLKNANKSLIFSDIENF